MKNSMNQKDIGGRLYKIECGKLYVRQYTGFKLVWDNIPSTILMCTFETIVSTYLKQKEDKTL